LLRAERRGRDEDWGEKEGCAEVQKRGSASEVDGCGGAEWDAREKALRQAGTLRLSCGGPESILY
jgi:hypothetical protein